MNIKQLSEIHCFYTHFLVKIRQVETSHSYKHKNLEYKKKELTEWLNHHKSLKTFGENVRHEIFHMLDLLASEVTICKLEVKISNFESNCEKIRNELEDQTFLKGIIIRPESQRSVSERIC